MSDRNRKEKNEPFGEIVKSMNQFFQEKPVRGLLQTMDDFFKNPFPFASSFHVDLKENAHEHIITAELPGVNREQIQLNVFDHYITITVLAADIFTEEDSHQNIVRKQQTMKKASRTIPLPHPINEKKVKASYQNGLLQIRVPKQKGKPILIDEIK
ncbi:Hsp20/alpha crystallin family protein [Bacillus sp. FJAT-29790]|uniref:Hsp20/alpha crystallin family protein n=1 Tax=Bacillus sp. FJAT-29790 TaxID=1895002 RepID=UPI001C239054|nr:Hsp20/alpha crystallin family protein [Bacillus sp. FJAT-29790]MBU8879054.1 Hsp20/alpha crystallin family protein [Bacillus sp. FJAT-29790]